MSTGRELVHECYKVATMLLQKCTTTLTS